MKRIATTLVVLTLVGLVTDSSIAFCSNVDGPSPRAGPRIHVAAMQGDIETIARELAEGVAVDLPSDKSRAPRWQAGSTPLMWAAARGRPDAVRFLLEAGADIHARSERGITPLMAAAGAMPTIGSDLLSCVRLLIKAGADLEAIDQEGRTAIFHACGDGSVLEYPRDEVLREEFRIPTRGIYIRPKVGGAIGVNHLAPQREVNARKGDARRLAALIEAGANVNAIDKYGRSVLMRAAVSSDPERVRLLLDADADSSGRAVAAAGRGGNGIMLELILAVAQQVGGIDADGDDAARLMVTSAGSREDSGHKVRLLLDAGLDPNSLWRGRTALIASVGWGGQGDATTRLLDAGADPRVRDHRGDTTLLLCAHYGSASPLEALLRRGFDIAERSQSRARPTALILAAKSRRDAGAKVDLLLAGGADIEAATEDGITPLLAASMEGNMDAVAALANAGARVNVADPGPIKDERGTTHRPGAEGMTPLMYVANRGASGTFHCEATGERAIKTLLDRGAQIDAATPTGETALHFALKSKHPQVVRILLEAHADPNTVGAEPHNARDGFTESPLHIAISYLQPDAVQAIIEAGADLQLRVGFPATPPLGLAAKERAGAEIVEMLLNARAPIDQRDGYGTTALMHAIQPDGWYAPPSDERRSIRLLLEAGADIHITDNEGRTALMIAARSDRLIRGPDDDPTEFVRALLERGASPHERDHSGMTPLIYAAYSRYPERLKVLLEAGADPHAVDDQGRTALVVGRLMWRRGSDAPTLVYLESLYESLGK